MKTKKISAASSKTSKPRSKSKTTPLGESIVRGLQEAAAHLRGEIKLRTRVVLVADAIDVRAIRESAGLSQAQFAKRYCLNPRTVQEWEQGRSRPDGAVRAYLTVIARNPRAVEDALAC